MQDLDTNLVTNKRIRHVQIKEEFSASAATGAARTSPCQSTSPADQLICQQMKKKMDVMHRIGLKNPTCPKSIFSLYRWWARASCLPQWWKNYFLCQHARSIDVNCVALNALKSNLSLNRCWCMRGCSLPEHIRNHLICQQLKK